MLTVVIPTIKFSTKLVRAVQSAISIGNDANVIVLDNSPSGIGKMLTSAFDEPSSFEIFANKSQLDMAENWNRCFEISSTKYTLMLHDDDYLAEGIDLSFLASDADLYILEGLLLRNHESSKLGSLDKICSEDLIFQSLIEFPGVQRQVWKTKIIQDNKFCSEYFPVFDYIWYSRQIDQSPKMEYSKGLKLVIEYHDEQSTKKIFWSFSVAKVFFRFLFKRNSYSNRKVYKLMMAHLFDRLKKSIHSDILRLKVHLWH